MIGNLNGWHLVIILFVILLLFGAPKLPGLARSLGQSMKIFKKEISTSEEKGDGTADNAEATAETPAAQSEAKPATKAKPAKK